jgi:tripartite-type tricarboxylate transporter receptor subunit TctC
VNICNIKLLTLLIASLAAVSNVYAQDYPTKPVRLVVPFAPGGTTDVAGRLIATGLQSALGQTIVVENKPGAGGNIGADVVAKASPDGYTLLLTSSALTINPAIYDKMPYSITKDLEPVGLLMTTALVLVGSPKSNIRSVADLVTQAKAKPGSLTFGSAGVGSGSHLAGELFNQTAHIQTRHIPYKGSGPATTAVAGGEVDFTFTSQAGTLPFYQSGKVQVLAVTAKTPSPLFPGVPTVTASGVKGFEAGDWIGIMAPAGTPKAIVSRLSNELTKWVGLPETKKRLAELGFEPQTGTPQQFGDLIRAEITKWDRTAKAGSIKAE